MKLERIILFSFLLLFFSGSAFADDMKVKNPFDPYCEELIELTLSGNDIPPIYMDKEARDRLRSIEEMVSKGVYLPTKKIPLFSKVAEDWLEYKKPNAYYA